MVCKNIFAPEPLQQMSDVSPVGSTLSYTLPAQSVVTFSGTGTGTSNILSINDDNGGTGNNQFEYVGTWGYYGAQTGAFNKDNHYSNVLNDYYNFRFNGTQVKIYASKAANAGIEAISIDGGAETLVDTYQSTRSDNVLIYTSPTLSTGSHIIKVRSTHTKNISSTDYYTAADRVDVVN
jgi:hypothetical protein